MDNLFYYKDILVFFFLSSGVRDQTKSSNVNTYPCQFRVLIG